MIITLIVEEGKPATVPQDCVLNTIVHSTGTLTGGGQVLTTGSSVLDDTVPLLKINQASDVAGSVPIVVSGLKIPLKKDQQINIFANGATATVILYCAT